MTRAKMEIRRNSLFMKTMAPRWIFSAISATFPSPPEYLMMRDRRMKAMINPTIPAAGVKIGFTVIGGDKLEGNRPFKTFAAGYAGGAWKIGDAPDLAIKMAVLPGRKGGIH